jgi:hypothetical protein
MPLLLCTQNIELKHQLRVQEKTVRRLKHEQNEVLRKVQQVESALKLL